MDTNLKIVFPNYTKEQRTKIRNKSCYIMARTIVDFLRAPKLSEEWMRQHVKFSISESLIKQRNENPKRPIFFVTGHLGSFELLSYITRVFIGPMGVVARDFKHAALQRWWTSRRELSGNNVISRHGGLKTIIRQLKSGRNVGLLFDQNVTRNNAVFVPWFGVPAATSAAIGFTILQINPIVVMFSIRFLEGENYEVDTQQMDFTDILEDQNRNRDQKILDITERMVKSFEEMIYRDPAAWFWMHRRWKTRPEGEPETIYTKGLHEN